MGVNHETIGQWLCEKWNLPSQIQETVSNHHSLKASLEQKTIAVVFLGNKLTNLRFSDYDYITDNLSILSCCEWLNLSHEDLQEIVESIKTKNTDQYYY